MNTWQIIKTETGYCITKDRTLFQAALNEKPFYTFHSMSACLKWLRLDMAKEGKAKKES